MEKKIDWIPAAWRPADDKDEMLAMMAEYWGKNEFSTPQFYDWQYVNNPAGRAVIALARDKQTGRLAGQYVVIAADVTVHGKRYPAALSVNTLTRKEYSGQGIFTKLAEIVYKQCAESHRHFTYGFPNANSYPGFIRKLNFTDLGSVPLLILPVDFSKLLATRFGKVIGAIATGMGSFNKGLLQSLYRRKTHYRVNKISMFDEAYDRFWQRASGKYPVMITRDSAYLNWRFFKSPQRTYDVFEVRDQKSVLGFSVIRNAVIEKVNTGAIVDFMVEPSSAGERAGLDLLRMSVLSLLSQQVAIIGCLNIAETQEYSLLRRFGFMVAPPMIAPRKFPVIVRTHIDTDTQINAVRDLKNWYLSMGDYDVI